MRSSPTFLFISSHHLLRLLYIVSCLVFLLSAHLCPSSTRYSLAESSNETNKLRNRKFLSSPILSISENAEFRNYSRTCTTTRLFGNIAYIIPITTNRLRHLKRTVHRTPHFDIVGDLETSKRFRERSSLPKLSMTL